MALTSRSPTRRPGHFQSALRIPSRLAPGARRSGSALGRAQPPPRTRSRVEAPQNGPVRLSRRWPSASTSCFTRTPRFSRRAPPLCRPPLAAGPTPTEEEAGGGYLPYPGTPGGISTSSAFTRPAESFPDSQARFDLLTKLTRLLERCHTQLRGSFQYLTTLEYFPRVFARPESLPTPLLEELYRALVVDWLAVELFLRSTVVAAETQAISATRLRKKHCATRMRRCWPCSRRALSP